MAKDYYQILGVSRTASQEEIKRAFRRLAQKHHPDKGGNAEKFKEIGEAYQVLSDVQKRRQFDQFGTTFEGMHGHGFSWQDFAQNFGRQEYGFGGPGISFDLGDLGEMMGDIFGFGRASRKVGPRRGNDLQTETTIDFAEAVFGTVRRINLSKKSVCSHCQGNGAEPGSKIINCFGCQGSGQVQFTQSTFLGAIQTVRTCSDCQGVGQTPEKKCRQCAGRGAVQASKEINVKIPAGIESGEIIKLANEGEAGERGGPPGDFFLIIRVRPDERFQRENNDITSRREIPFTTAALGGKVNVVTIHGEIQLKIPAGTQSGQVFKIKGKGVPNRRGFGTGDHLVEIVVAVPKRLSSSQKQLLKELDL